MPRPLVKWFLRQTTRLCELQRICYGEPSGAPRTIAVGMKLPEFWQIIIPNPLIFHFLRVSFVLCSQHRGLPGSFKELGDEEALDKYGQESSSNHELGGHQGLPGLNVQPDHEDQGDQGGLAQAVCSVHDHLPETNLGIQAA